MSPESSQSKPANQPMVSQEKPLCGVLIVDKPLGWTSMDVVRKVKSSANIRKLKVGHAGTLDPLATGVLVCCIGKATRLANEYMGQSKVYETTIDLSAFTRTDDRDGERTEVEVATPPTLDQLNKALQSLVGNIEQTPPVFSAIRVQGERAYALAREGREVSLNSRIVVVHEINLLAYQWPLVDLRIHCGKGTYIRSMARDLGKALNTGGHLASLRRTRSGRFQIEQAIDGRKLLEYKITQADLIPIPSQES